MMKDYSGIIFLILLALLILYIIYSFLKRRKELADWARSNGLAFSAEKDWSFNSKYPGLDCLHIGYNQYAYNIMKGNIAGREFVGCDFHYAIGKEQYLFSLEIIKSPILLEPLLIRPENTLDKFAAFAGFNDIDFESAEFSKKFYVKSPNKKWAYDIINPQMMEFLLTMPVFSIQLDSFSIIVYSETTLFSTANFESAIKLVSGIFQRIPDYVIQNQKLRST